MKKKEQNKVIHTYRKTKFLFLYIFTKKNEK